VVARAGTDQTAVVHERSLASRLTTTATPPPLEIRRRVSPGDRVRTATGKFVKEAQMLHPALRRALATAQIEDLHRTATTRQTIRLQQGGPKSRESQDPDHRQSRVRTGPRARRLDRTQRYR